MSDMSKMWLLVAVLFFTALFLAALISFISGNQSGQKNNENVSTADTADKTISSEEYALPLTEGARLGSSDLKNSFLGTLKSVSDYTVTLQIDEGEKVIQFNQDTIFSKNECREKTVDEMALEELSLIDGATSSEICYGVDVTATELEVGNSVVVVLKSDTNDTLVAESLMIIP